MVSFSNDNLILLLTYQVLLKNAGIVAHVTWGIVKHIAVIERARFYACTVLKPLNVQQQMSTGCHVMFATDIFQEKLVFRSIPKKPTDMVANNPQY